MNVSRHDECRIDTCPRTHHTRHTLRSACARTRRAEHSSSKILYDSNSAAMPTRDGEGAGRQRPRGASGREVKGTHRTYCKLACPARARTQAGEKKGCPHGKKMYHI